METLKTNKKPQIIAFRQLWTWIPDQRSNQTEFWFRIRNQHHEFTKQTHQKPTVSISDQNEPQPVPLGTTCPHDSKPIPTCSHLLWHQEKPLLCTVTHTETLKTTRNPKIIAFWQLRTWIPDQGSNQTEFWFRIRHQHVRLRRKTLKKEYFEILFFSKSALFTPTTWNPWLTPLTEI